MHKRLCSMRQMQLAWLGSCMPSTAREGSWAGSPLRGAHVIVCLVAGSPGLPAGFAVPYGLAASIYASFLVVGGAGHEPHRKHKQMSRPCLLPFPCAPQGAETRPCSVHPGICAAVPVQAPAAASTWQRRRSGSPRGASGCQPEACSLCAGVQCDCSCRAAAACSLFCSAGCGSCARGQHGWQGSSGSSGCAAGGGGHG